MCVRNRERESKNQLSLSTSPFQVRIKRKVEEGSYSFQDRFVKTKTSHITISH